ncbi:MAG: hypothetical protein L6253_00865 [Candidatus Atribacteria bacterium]|nr:hypothetical protein [Candidatus Atribacteria bacterium]
MKRIAYIITKPGNEEDVKVLEWLKKRNYPDIDFIKVEQFSETENIDAIWIHSIEDLVIEQNMIDWLKGQLDKGINLLLTMNAVKLLVTLGLEEKKALRLSRNQIRGMRDIKGFQSYDGHPLFKGLNNGVYILQPSSLVKSTINYQGTKADVIAVEKSYISYHINKRLIWKYKTANGLILAISSFLSWKIYENNLLAANFDKFMENVFDYITGPSNFDQETYFSIQPSSGTHKVAVNYNKTLNICSKDFEYQTCGLSISSPPSSNLYDLAGRRLLLMGNENGGVTEIWAHPYRVLKKFKLTIDRETITKYIKDFIVYPEFVYRKLIYHNGNIEEYIQTALEAPVAAIEYRFNLDKELRLTFSFEIDLRAMWPRTDYYMGKIEYGYDDKLGAVFVSDKKRRCRVLTGCNIKPYQVKFKVRENISNVHIEMTFNIKSGKTKLIFAVAAAQQTEDELELFCKAFDVKLINNDLQAYYTDLQKKMLYFETGDKEFNNSFDWAKVGIDKFYAETPGLGKGFLAGFANTGKGWHKARPGYAWYFGRDSEWCSLGVLGYGDSKKVKENLNLLMKYQNIDGKIFHEITTSGVIHYDSADATPLFLIVFQKYVSCTGDYFFLKKNWDNFKTAVKFCLSTDFDKDHLIENTNVGHGWIESGKLNSSHASLYLNSIWAKALQGGVIFAKFMNESELAKRWEEESKEVLKAIDLLYWDEKTQYYALGINSSGKQLKFKTIMPSIPLYFKLVDPSKAHKMLIDFSSSKFSSDWGVRIIDKKSSFYQAQSYHEGSIWPLFTGWTSLAEYAYGRGLQGYFHLMNNILLYKDWTKGYIGEVFDGEKYIPSGVCPHQAWSETMVIQPVVEGMLGYEPDMLAKGIVFSPNFPSHWDKVKICNLPYGNTKLNLEYSKKCKSSRWIVRYDLSGELTEEIALEFCPFLPPFSKVIAVRANGKTIKYTICNKLFAPQVIISSHFKEAFIIEIEYGCDFEIIPPVPYPKMYQKSTSIRILDIIQLNAYNYIIKLEGVPEKTYNTKLIHNPETKIISSLAEFIKPENISTTLGVKFPKSKDNYVSTDIDIIVEDKR